jgi:hypothetical protein
MITVKPSITSISAGQKEQLVRVVSDSARKAAGVAVDDLSEAGVLNSANFQQTLKRGNEIVAEVTALVKRKIAEYAENIIGILRLLSGVEELSLDKTDGTELLANAANLFTGYLDSDFVNYGTNVSSSPAPATKIAVYEMVENGDFAKIFGSFSTDLDKLCLSQGQIIQFVKKHSNWLHPDGWATFILFKVNGDFFVARVYRVGGGLEASVDRFSSDRVWGAEYRRRVVVPQLRLES